MARLAPVNLVLLSQLLWCAGASAKSSGALVCLVPNLLVLLRQKLLFTSRGSRQDACTSTTQYPVNGEYLFCKLKIFKFLLVVPWWCLVAGDGEPFDIELYPPGLDAAHQLMSKEELQHMFGVDEPHLVDHTR